jgi:hypothetical protein
LNKIFPILILCFVFILAGVIKSQNKERVGVDQVNTQQGGFYNYGEKDKVNIEIGVWGFVKNPGKYIIPLGSTFIDLISYAGGPLNEANLDDIRLFRPKNDTLKITKDELIRLNYYDLFWEKEINTNTNRNIILKPGDVIIFPGSPKYYFRDNLTLILSVATTLVSIAVLMVTISNK